MKYVVDIDRTICHYPDKERYEDAIPMLDRIEKINKLYEQGHTIIYHTARGMGRTDDNVKQAIKIFYDFTERQLKSWGAKFHDLILGKPSGDYYIDDKAINDKDFFDNNRKIVDKGWGYEEVLVNTPKYCSKILHMNKGKKLSWHYHKIKDETFYVENGKALLYYGEDEDIETAYTRVLNPGDIFHIPTGLIHRLEALENSRIFEFSTQHFDYDSYRVLKGD
jgi:mannose-6-phosphate isomerase-like protein (cupin superfamily)